MIVPLAHSADTGRPEQSYPDHVAGAVRRGLAALDAISGFLDDGKASDYAGILHAALLYHDLGKLNEKNQAVLRRERTADRLPIEHRDAGVALTLQDRPELAAATLIYAHHFPGLPNLMEQKAAAHPFRFPDAMEDTREHLRQYTALHQSLLGKVEIPACRALEAVEYRLLLGLMSHADYASSAPERPSPPNTRWQERLSKLERFTAKRKPSRWPAGAITALDCPVEKERILAAAAALLRLPEPPKQLFVVMPDEGGVARTVTTLRDALVLKGEKPDEIVRGTDSQTNGEANERCAMTREALVTVTTASQFFQTLSGNLPSELCRLPQLVGGGVILDGLHTALTVGRLPLAWRWLTWISEHWRCLICLSSETGARFWESRVLQSLAPVTPIPIAAVLPSADAATAAFLEQCRLLGLGSDPLKPERIRAFADVADMFH